MFKVLKNGTAPTRGSKYSACVDLYASNDVIIGAGETAVVGLGVCIDFSDNWKYKNGMVDSHCFGVIKENIEHNSFRYFKKTHYLQLNPQSSIRSKGLISGVEVIYLDFEQEIKIIIHNPYQNSQHNGNYPIKKGDKLAQITLLEHKSYLFGCDGGFGSTDGKG